MAASPVSDHERAPVAVAPRVVALLTAGALVAFGALMWARHGEAVFTDLISAAVAWCF